MISHRLDIALQEAILEHALRYKHGALEVEAILSALGEMAATYLAEVPNVSDRQRLFKVFCTGIATGSDGKTRQRVIEPTLKA